MFFQYWIYVSSIHFVEWIRGKNLLKMTNQNIKRVISGNKQEEKKPLAWHTFKNKKKWVHWKWAKMSSFQNFDTKRMVFHDSACTFNYIEKVCNDIHVLVDSVMPFKVLYFVMILCTYTWKITGSFCMRCMIHSICREDHSQTHTFGVFFHSSLNTRGLSPTIWEVLGCWNIPPNCSLLEKSEVHKLRVWQ